MISISCRRTKAVLSLWFRNWNWIWNQIHSLQWMQNVFSLYQYLINWNESYGWIISRVISIFDILFYKRYVCMYVCMYVCLFVCVHMYLKEILYDIYWLHMVNYLIWSFIGFYLNIEIEIFLLFLFHKTIVKQTAWVSKNIFEKLMSKYGKNKYETQRERMICLNACVTF